MAKWFHRATAGESFVSGASLRSAGMSIYRALLRMRMMQGNGRWSQPSGSRRRGQHAEVFAEQDIPVDLGFIVPERNDAALQVAADACIQRVAKLQKCRCLAAVDAAADVVFAQPVGIQAVLRGLRS